MNQKECILTKLLNCGNGKIIDLGQEAVLALVKYFEEVTDCEKCNDKDMCDQVKFDCPMWSK